MGTNKNDIISIKNTGNIGINTTNPQSTLDMKIHMVILKILELIKILFTRGKFTNERW